MSLFELFLAIILGLVLGGIIGNLVLDINRYLEKGDSDES